MALIINEPVLNAGRLQLLLSGDSLVHNRKL